MDEWLELHVLTRDSTLSLASFVAMSFADLFGDHLGGCMCVCTSVHRYLQPTVAWVLHNLCRMSYGSELQAWRNTSNHMYVLLQGIGRKG